jgi:hypothetical protein
MEDGKKITRKLRMDILWVIGIFVIWFLLVRFVLPKMGVST